MVGGAETEEELEKIKEMEVPVMSQYDQITKAPGLTLEEIRFKFTAGCAARVFHAAQVLMGMAICN